jgi:hypothetical protein
MRAFAHLLAATGLLLLAGCLFDRAPAYRPGEIAFFACDSCLTLEGGAYGKGTTRSFRGRHAADCGHQWRRITQSEFEALATRWYGFDWRQDAAPWTGAEPGAGEATTEPTRRH